MWCFGMRNSFPWWVRVVCMGLASFGASRKVSGGTAPVAGGGGRFRLQARGCDGLVRRDLALVLCLELAVRCLYILAVRQVVTSGSGYLCEVLVEQCVLGPFG